MRACQECGKSLVHNVRGTRIFCDEPCRQSFNKRRRERGAELYDAIMSSVNGGTLQKLIDAYKLADAVKRHGRRSWQPWPQASLKIPLVYGSDGDGR